MLTRRSALHVTLVALLLAVAALSCGRPDQAISTPALRLATTEAVDASGLLQEILPDFEEDHGVQVEVIVGGTEEVLALGEQGDVDVVLVHAPRRDDRFVEEGFGIKRHDVMYTDFVIVGPETDPAEIRGAATATEAFARIADRRAPFASRGDQSGTHDKELEIWDATGTAPAPLTGWYQSLGQGMGETLVAANEQRAYTLTDRATYIRMRDTLPELAILFGGETIDQNPDTGLRNLYSVIQVNPETHPSVNAELAATFIQWVTSPDVQARIGAFGLEQYGQPLFLSVATP